VGKAIPSFLGLEWTHGYSERELKGAIKLNTHNCLNLNDTLMTTISDPIEIAGLTIWNRIVMPPMVVRLASDSGEVTDKLIEHYERRSQGGAGLIIVEASAIAWEHRIGMKNIGIHDDSMIPGLRKLADGIKAHGARAFIQINHSHGLLH